MGPCSAIHSFSTIAQETKTVYKNSPTSTSGTPVHSHKHKIHSTWAPLARLRSMTDREKVFLIAVCMVILGIVISMIIASVCMK